MTKAAMVSFLIFLSIQASAQAVEEYLAKKLLIGFNVGINYSNILAPSNSSNQSKANNGSGFRLGIVMSEEVYKDLIISPKAELSFNDCNVAYSNSVNGSSNYQIFPISVDLTMHFNRKLNAVKKHFYVLGGPSIRIPIVQKTGGLGSVPPSYGNSPDLALDLGCGLNRVLPYFHFAPELRYSIGLLNINKDPNLDRVYFHNITLVLNIKG